MSTMQSSLLPPTTIPSIDTTPNVLGTTTIPIKSASPTLIETILADSSHPAALISHYVFKIGAVAVYLFSQLFLGSSFVMVFVSTVLFLAIDFWIVKNVSGRLLIGRRWWTATGMDGNTIWTFEVRPKDSYRPNATDSRLFWAGLYGFTTLWVLLGLTSILSFNFSWLVVVLFALTLNVTNLMGYIKCDRESQQRTGATGISGSILSGIFSTKISSLFS